LVETCYQGSVQRRWQGQSAAESLSHSLLAESLSLIRYWPNRCR
jgi:hypothetical protein